MCQILITKYIVVLLKEMQKTHKETQKLKNDKILTLKISINSFVIT